MEATMVDITEFKQDDWIDIYENLEGDMHLSKAGLQQLRNMQQESESRKLQN